MRKAVYVRIRIYYCPRWRPGGGFPWALRTHFLWLSSTGCWQADIFYFIFLFFDTGGEKGGGRVARLAWMHFPSLSASVAGLKSVSAAGWMSCGHWPVVKKDPHHMVGAGVFSFLFLSLAEQLKHRKCKNVEGGGKKLHCGATCHVASACNGWRVTVSQLFHPNLIGLFFLRQKLLLVAT